MAITSWRNLIQKEMDRRGESFADVVHSTLSEQELDVKFYDGYGGSKGKEFTLWTAKRVYFPAVYDGAEWCESVPRDPCDESTAHIGGQ